MQVDVHREILNEVEHDMLVLGEKLRQLQAVAQYHASKLGVSPQLPEPLAHSNGDSPSTVNGNGLSSTRFKSLNQREAAAIILRESGEPMRAGNIARVMIKYGYPKPSKIGKLTNALFTTMTRDAKRFKKVGVGLWDLVDSADASESEDSA